MTIFLNILIFWLVIQLFNLIGLPVAFRLFKNLPDRGYGLARPLGLLLSGYGLWLLGSLGLLKNNLGGAVLAMGLVAGLGIFWLQQERGEGLLAWLKANRTYVLTVEAVFALAFIGWAVFKAYNPAIETAGGEKWMEIAFVNSALLSPGFPPQDPWLSGFGISYYYFGYVLMALLTRLSGIAPTTAYNLFAPTLFALTVTGAFAVVANMIAAYRRDQAGQFSLNAAIIRWNGLLGSVFVAVMGHWEGVLEVLHKRGLLPAAFWQWLDIRDLKIPPEPPFGWLPDRFIWWWRGSRVLTDYNLPGQEQEVIDEMPFFSFMLGDVHPHVLALPFVLLAIALALNLLLARRPSASASGSFIRQALSNLIGALGGKTAFVLYAVCIGALGFLNTWDLPIYLAVLGLAYWVWPGRAGLEQAFTGLGLFAATAIALYLPFYVSFRSQAGGILPNLWNPTRLNQFTVFFGPFLLIGLALLAILSRARPTEWRKNLPGALALTILGPIGFLLLLILFFLFLSPGQEFVSRILSDPAVAAALGGASQGDLLREIAARRLAHPWTFLGLAGLIGWGLALLWPALKRNNGAAPEQTRPVEQFALILLVIGLALPLSVEFVYLRDLFMTRMNTIFKFYFQAWVLLALAGAFGAYRVGQSLAGLKRQLWRGLVAVLVLGGLVYPLLALPNKTGNFASTPTLDGIYWVAQYRPDDYAGIMWLSKNAAPNAVVLEHPGKSYTYYSRVSALTGRATLVGWEFHEYQWRGNAEETGRRLPEIDILYNGIDPATTLTLLDKYAINYVYVGPLERETYSPAGLAKFDTLLEKVFSQGDVAIYRR